jgi:hypothetical protein
MLTAAQRQDMLFFACLILMIFSLAFFALLGQVQVRALAYSSCRDADNALVYCIQQATSAEAVVRPIY